ncbi:MAG: tail fiber protein [Deltaproteobacteria bacterium]
MDEYYIGTIQLFPYKPGTGDWLPCDGSLLRADDGVSEGLFAVLGNRFGGSGIVFGLPDLRAASPNDKIKYYILRNWQYPNN